MSKEEKGWANAAPAGLVGLAVACFCFFALLGGRVEHSCLPLLGCWLIGGALVQYTVAIMEYKEGAITGGNIFLVFAAFFMMVSGLEMIFKYLALAQGWPAIDSRIDGYAWLSLWICIWLMTPAYFKSPVLMTVLIVGIDIGVPIVSLHDLGLISNDYLGIASYAFLGAGVCGLYISGATILNAEYGKTVLPLPGPLFREKTIVGRSGPIKESLI